MKKRMNIHLEESRLGCEKLPKLLGTLAMICSLHSATEMVWLTAGDEDGHYFNLDIESGDVKSIWPQLQVAITSSLPLEFCLTVTCQGNDGWNDYLLLYDSDENQVLDTL